MRGFYCHFTELIFNHIDPCQITYMVKYLRSGRVLDHSPAKVPAYIMYLKFKYSSRDLREISYMFKVEYMFRSLEVCVSQLSYASFSAAPMGFCIVKSTFLQILRFNYNCSMADCIATQYKNKYILFWKFSLHLLLQMFLLKTDFFNCSCFHKNASEALGMHTQALDMIKYNMFPHLHALCPVYCKNSYQSQIFLHCYSVGAPCHQLLFSGT